MERIRALLGCRTVEYSNFKHRSNLIVEEFTPLNRKRVYRDPSYLPCGRVLPLSGFASAFSPFPIHLHPPSEWGLHRVGAADAKPALHLSEH